MSLFKTRTQLIKRLWDYKIKGGLFIKRKSKIIVALMLLVLFLSISVSFASDANNADDIQTTNDIDDAVALASETETVSSIENTTDSNGNNLLGSSNDEKLTDSSGSFTDLDKLIRSSEGELTLDQDYVFDSTDSILEISSDDFVLDFNGHTLNANSHSGNVMKITGNHVTLKNLKFINGAGTYSIIWSGENGLMDNMTMSNTNYGIQWTGVNGHLTNSCFINLANYAIYSVAEGFKFTNSEVKDITTVNYIIGLTNAIMSHIKFSNIYNTNGAMHGFMSTQNTEVSYCDFINCRHPTLIWTQHSCNYSHLYFENVTANNNRGIVIVTSGSYNCNLEYITFKNCRVLNGESSGTLVNLNNPTIKMHNCTFDGIYDSRYCLKISGSVISDCTFKNCNIYYDGILRTDRYDGSIIRNCKFINNTARNGAGIYTTHLIVVENCMFINNTATANGGAIYLGKSKSTISGCTFINNHATLGNSIYAVNNLNLKLNGTGNLWYENYTADVYAPGAYDDMYTHLYVSQNGGGSGIDSNNPTTLDDALTKITIYGTIEFVNNGEVYSISKTITVPVNLIGNGITVTNTGTVFSLNSCTNMELSGFKFVKCGSTSVNSPIYYYGYGIKISDCEFINCTGKLGGAFYSLYESGYTDTSGVVFDKCKFIGNKATQDHGYNSGAISLTSIGSGIVSNCEFINNSGIYSGAFTNFGYGGVYRIVNCNFTGNTASKADGGGAIRLSVASNEIDNCRFESNSAPNGALYVATHSLTLTNSNFTKNSATTGNGGAITLTSSARNSIISNCKFNENTAISGAAGAICVNTKITIENSDFIGNNAKTNAGAILLQTSASDSVISNSKFEGNKAVDGSAIYSQIKVNIIESNFTNNIASGNGGIYLTVDSKIDGNTFRGNKAVNGGAIYGSQYAVDNCEFYSNAATTGNGGAIYASKLTIDDSTLKDNTANSGNGGAIYLADESTINNIIFGANKAINGGAIFVAKDNVLILNSVLQNNTATGLGGAIYITDNCAYYVDVSSQESYSGNTASQVTSKDIYNLHAKAMLGEVCIVLNPNSIPGNTFEGDRNNPVDIQSGLSKVAPGGKLIFIVSGETYTASTSYNTITSNKQGIKLIGNNTIMKGYTVIASQNQFEVHNFIFTESSDAVFICIGSDCVINNCTFRENGGVSCSNASAVRVLGDNLTITNSKFINNRVGESNTEVGGCVFVNASNLRIVDSLFDGNAANYGAHLYVCEEAVGVNIIDSRFINANAVNFDGVGLLFKNHEGINIESSNFTDNIYGGAIRFDDEVLGLKVTNNNFVNNKANSNGHAVNGGAISISTSVNSIIEDNTFDSNSASNYGGALYISSGDLIVRGNDFKNNRANYGGAIYSGAKLTLLNSNFTNNVASVDGGALYLNGATNVLTNIVLKENNAAKGSAIYLSNGNCIELNNVNVKDNTHSTTNPDGGDVYIGDNAIFNVPNSDLVLGNGQTIRLNTYTSDVIYVGVTAGRFGMGTEDDPIHDFATAMEHVKLGGKIVFLPGTYSDLIKRLHFQFSKVIL